MPGEYGVRNADGSVSVIDADTGREIRHETWEQNQGLPPAGSQPMTVVGGDNPPGGTGSLAGFDPSRGPDGQPLQPGQRWERTANGNFVFVDPNRPGQTQWRDPQTGQPTSTPPGGSSAPGALSPLLDAIATDNTARLQALIAQAYMNYATAISAEERQRAYLDLQRWQTELAKAENQQKAYTDVAQTILSAATSLGARPADYPQFNRIVSGGRDIFDIMSGKATTAPAFGATQGYVRAGSVEDLLGRLGLQYPQTPATPAGVQPGAAIPGLTPSVHVPGVPAAGVPPPTGGGAAAPAGGLPSLDEMKSGLRTAGWGGNYEDANAVADAWWNASPSRRGTPRPGF